MRVTFLTHYYPPEVGAPQARIANLARALAGRGVEVTVHTCPPHYPDGSVPPPHRNRLWQRQPAEGVEVVRSLVYPAANRGFGRRLADHASFAASAVLTSPLAPAADVVVAESPPLFLADAAIGYARLKRAPLILHVADLWPDSAIELGVLRRPGLIAAARRLETACYRAAAAIACPTAGIASRLREREDAAGKVRLIPPGVELGRFSPGPRTGADVFRVLYAGTIGLSQGLGTLLDAASRLGPGIEVVIAGDGAEAGALRERLRREGLRNVRMIGPVSHRTVPDLYAEADLAVVLLRDRPLFRGAVPTKLIEAMSAGRPVLLSGAGEAADLVREAGAGVVVPPERPAELAAAITAAAADRGRGERMGAAGRRAVERSHGPARVTEEWLRLLSAVAEPSRAQRPGGG